MKTHITSKYLPAFIAVLTFFGIALHDTKLDSMTTLAIAIPVAAMTFEAAHMLGVGEAHTHVEKVSVDRIAGRFTSQLPRVRFDSDDKKYRLAKHNLSGHNAFDDYLFPVGA